MQISCRRRVRTTGTDSEAGAAAAREGTLPHPPSALAPIDEGRTCQAHGLASELLRHTQRGRRGLGEIHQTVVNMVLNDHYEFVLMCRERLVAPRFPRADRMLSARERQPHILFETTRTWGTNTLRTSWQNDGERVMLLQIRPYCSQETGYAVERHFEQQVTCPEAMTVPRLAVLPPLVALWVM